MVEQEAKIILLGARVGKSSLAMRLVKELWIDAIEPTVEETYRKTMEVDGKPYRLTILDTPSKEEMRAMQEHYMRMEATFVIVYSVDSKDSLDAAHDVCKRLARLKGTTELTCCVLLGNKLDVDAANRAVSLADATALATQFKMLHFEASAKTGAGVADAFAAAVRLFSEARMAQPGQQHSPRGAQASDKPKKKEGGCCTVL